MYGRTYWRAVCIERCKHGSEGGCRKSDLNPFWFDYDGANIALQWSTKTALGQLACSPPYSVGRRFESCQGHLSSQNSRNGSLIRPITVSKLYYINDIRIGVTSVSKIYNHIKESPSIGGDRRAFVCTRGEQKGIITIVVYQRWFSLMPNLFILLYRVEGGNPSSVAAPLAPFI